MRFGAMLGLLLAMGSWGGSGGVLRNKYEPTLDVGVSRTKSKKGGSPYKSSGIAKQKRAARKARNIKRNKANH